MVKERLKRKLPDGKRLSSGVKSKDKQCDYDFVSEDVQEFGQDLFYISELINYILYILQYYRYTRFILENVHFERGPKKRNGIKGLITFMCL